VPNYRTISDVPGFVDRFKKALSKRKDFTPSEGQTPGERQSEGPTQPAGTGSSECTGTSANAGRVRETSRGQELSLDIDIRKDTQASLLEKARFLIDNGRALEALAKQMSKKTKENGRWKKEKVKPEPATFATNRAGHAGAELPAINRVDSVAGGSVVQSASPVTPNGATPSQDELNRKMLEKQTLLTEKQNLEQMKNMIESGDNAPLVIELLKAQGMTPEQLKTRLVEIDKKLKELGG